MWQRTNEIVRPLSEEHFMNGCVLLYVGLPKNIPAMLQQLFKSKCVWAQDLITRGSPPPVALPLELSKNEPPQPQEWFNYANNHFDIMHQQMCIEHLYIGYSLMISNTPYQLCNCGLWHNCKGVIDESTPAQDIVMEIFAIVVILPCSCQRIWPISWWYATIFGYSVITTTKASVSIHRGRQSDCRPCCTPSNPDICCLYY